MKTLSVPLLTGVEETDLDTALELEGARFDISEVNWPSDYPYAPFAHGRIARTEDALVVAFRVRGLDRRGRHLGAAQQPGADSCVEFFVEDPDGRLYYNFEINPLGKVLAARGASRTGRVQRPREEMQQILRTAQLEGEQDFEGGIWNWRVTLVIPFELIGVDSEALPEQLRANFYKCGDKTAHPHYVSWNPVETPAPDFHRPEYFGQLRLV